VDLFTAAEHHVFCLDAVGTDYQHFGRNHQTERPITAYLSGMKRKIANIDIRVEPPDRQHRCVAPPTTITAELGSGNRLHA
jgi:hypothetical protein